MSNLNQSSSGPASARMINARVHDADGRTASMLSLHGGEGDAQQALVQLDDGTQLLVPLTLMSEQDDGSYTLPFAFEGGDARIRIPVIQEELQVGKRTIDTGRGVRLHKSVEQRVEQVDQPLLREEFVVEHVPVGRVIGEGELPQTRYEGETLVMPVLEEVLVVHKQLLLKEEVRVTRRRQQVHEPQQVVLRSEQVKVERFE